LLCIATKEVTWVQKQDKKKRKESRWVYVEKKEGKQKGNLVAKTIITMAILIKVACQTRSLVCF
jgi:hypothetical protein